MLLAKYSIMVDVGRKGDSPEELRRKSHNFSNFWVFTTSHVSSCLFHRQTKKILGIFSAYSQQVAISTVSAIFNYIDQTERASSRFGFRKKILIFWSFDLCKIDLVYFVSIII